MSCCGQNQQPFRSVCGGKPIQGMCGSDTNMNYEFTANRKPSVTEVINMALKVLTVPGGYVYFCNRGSSQGVVVRRNEQDGQFVVLPNNIPLDRQRLPHYLTSVLLSVCTDAISMCSGSNSTTYNKAEIDIQSDY